MSLNLLGVLVLGVLVLWVLAMVVLWLIVVVATVPVQWGVLLPWLLLLLLSDAGSQGT